MIKLLKILEVSGFNIDVPKQVVPLMKKLEDSKKFETRKALRDLIVRYRAYSESGLSYPAWITSLRGNKLDELYKELQALDAKDLGNE